MASQTDRIRSALLVLRVQRGDTAAFEELATLWERPLFYYIRRLTRTEEDAWDVSQELWLRVHRKLGQLRDVNCFVPWLYRIARSAASNHFRANPEWNTLSESEGETVEQTSDPATAFSSEEAEAIHRALDQLPLPQREALTLHFLEEFSLQEISSITGVAVGTIKSRLHYGKRTLREIIQKDGYGHE